MTKSKGIDLKFDYNNYLNFSKIFEKSTIIYIIRLIFLEIIDKIYITIYKNLQILSITLFEKMLMLQAFTTDAYKNKITIYYIQLKLFDS